MKPFEIKGGFLSFFFIKVDVSPNKIRPEDLGLHDPVWIAGKESRF